MKPKPCRNPSDGWGCRLMDGGTMALLIEGVVLVYSTINPTGPTGNIAVRPVSSRPPHTWRKRPLVPFTLY